MVMGLKAETPPKPHGPTAQKKDCEPVPVSVIAWRSTPPAKATNPVLAPAPAILLPAASVSLKPAGTMSGATLLLLKLIFALVDIELASVTLPALLSTSNLVGLKLGMLLMV